MQQPNCWDEYVISQIVVIVHRVGNGETERFEKIYEFIDLTESIFGVVTPIYQVRIDNIQLLQRLNTLSRRMQQDLHVTQVLHKQAHCDHEL